MVFGYSFDVIPLSDQYFLSEFQKDLILVEKMI